MRRQDTGQTDRSNLVRGCEMSTTVEILKIENPRFEEWPASPAGQPQNLEEICRSWSLEIPEGSNRPTIDLHPLDLRIRSGLSLELRHVPTWVRVWQGLSLQGRQLQPEAEVILDIGAQSTSDVIKLDWVALLRRNAVGKRVFARKFFDGCKISPDWQTLRFPFEVKGLATDELYYFVVQLSGSGFACLRSCALEAPQRTSAPTSPPISVSSTAEAASKPSRRRVAVISWDMGHNPVGRAFLLADLAAQKNVVQLLGPLFPQYGGKLWPPIARSELSIHAFPASNLRSLVLASKEIAAGIKCDLVYVGKPRLPSLLLGALIKYHNHCPMVVDVDDNELSFTSNHMPASFEDLAKASPAEIDVPHSEIWTRFCETLIPACDMVTVSNPCLQRRFGGVIVRHARNEHHFNPRLYNRDKVRAEFCYGATDRVILFLGTPRAHKGIFSIADALENINNQHLALCVIGSITSKPILARLANYKKARIGLHPDQPWERLPELTAMADAVLILQDPTSPISQYQIPAKLTDALALGVEVFATRVPPLDDIISAGAVHPIEDAQSLDVIMRRLASKGPDINAKRRARSYFLSELSYRVNSMRIESVFEEASERPQDSSAPLSQLFEFLESRIAVSLPRFNGFTQNAVAISTRKRADLVFLWKQNDSDLYGRRSDMMVKYLLRSGNIGRILHLDAPISAATLSQHIQYGNEAKAHQGNHVFVNTMRRVLRLADTAHLTRRTFVYRARRNPESFLGIELPPKESYVEFIKRTCAEAGIEPNPILWVSPVVFDFPAIREALRPSLTIADIIDDQRRWQSNEEKKRRIENAYSVTLRTADLVIANCDAVKHGFSEIRSDIVVVPNGAEIFDDQESWSVPEELRSLPKPIIGYVGNLRDRVDLDLLRKVASAFAQGSIVLIGSAHDRPEVLELANEPNVRFLGVKPYTEAIRFIKAFDVAIMPHLVNEISNNMNPLKLYVYFSLEVPIVTTEVANIGDVAPYVGVASSHEDFIAELHLALKGSQKKTANARRLLLQDLSWDARVRDIWANLRNR